MPDPAISTMLAQPFLFGSDQTLHVVDSHSTRNVTIPKSVFFRVYLANAGNGGTSEADTVDLIAYVQAQVNAGAANFWTLALNATGRIDVTYNGGTGSASLGFTTPALGNALGVNGASLAFSAPAVTHTCFYHPMCTMFSVCRLGDTSWTGEPQKFAMAEMPDSSTYAWGDNLWRLVRGFDSAYHPSTLADANALGSNATQLYAATKARAKSPTRFPADALLPPFSVEEFLRSSVGVQLGFTDNYQALIAGSSAAFDDVFLTKDTANLSRANAPSQSAWAGRSNWKGITLGHFAEYSRT